MEKILIVEDSRLVAEVLKEKILSHWNFNVFLAHNIQDAKRIAHLHHKEMFLALLDLRLPDGPNGEIVDLMFVRSPLFARVLRPVWER